MRTLLFALIKKIIRPLMMKRLKMKVKKTAKRSKVKTNSKSLTIKIIRAKNRRKIQQSRTNSKLLAQTKSIRCHLKILMKKRCKSRLMRLIRKSLRKLQPLAKTCPWKAVKALQLARKVLKLLPLEPLLNKHRLQNPVQSPRLLLKRPCNLNALLQSATVVVFTNQRTL